MKGHVPLRVAEAVSPYDDPAVSAGEIADYLSTYKTFPVAKQKMEPHNLDVQMVADMLEKDNCPASMGAFTYPDGSNGLLLIMAKPEYAQQVKDFLQTLYAAAGYVSPKY
jgi:hypothetical protein